MEAASEIRGTFTRLHTSAATVLMSCAISKGDIGSRVDPKWCKAFNWHCYERQCCTWSQMVRSGVRGSGPGNLIMPSVGHVAQRKKIFTIGRQRLKKHTDGQHY